MLVETALVKTNFCKVEIILEQIVLITQQNLQKFEFLKVYSRKSQIFTKFAEW